MFASAALEQKQNADKEKQSDVEIDNFRCSITEMIFLEPISTTECGHTFEKSAIEHWCESKNYPPCPNCRKTIGKQPTEKNSLIPASHLVMASLQSALDKNPKYKDERYFNLSIFASVLSKGDSARLRNMINALHDSEKLLNTFSDEEKLQGFSPLYYLANHQNGLRYLASDASLRNNISSPLLNAVIENGTAQGKSILYLLSTTDAGRQILLKDSYLLRKITPLGLNRLILTGFDKGRSVLFMLASTESGRKILLKDLNLIGNMSPQTISAVINEGSERGKSVDYYLKNTDTGRQILEEYNWLRSRGKYIINQGSLQINPVRLTPNINISNEKLGIVASMEDVLLATTAYKEAKLPPMQNSQATIASIEIMQSDFFLEEFRSKALVDSAELLEGLTNSLAKYEAQLGLLNKVLALSEANLNFIISDDDSMKQSCKFKDQEISYWDAIEIRLHQMMELLVYIPFNTITINFLNRTQSLILRHQGETTTEFGRKAHEKISKLFDSKPSGPVSFFSKLKTLKSIDRTFHYFFTNNPPTDGSDKEVKLFHKILKERHNPANNPITFIKMSESSPNEWLNFSGPYIAIISDYLTSQAQWRDSQGSTFPYSEGFWLVCQLVAAFSPEDLSVVPAPPLDKFKMDNLMGRKLSDVEYQYYFKMHPYGKRKEYADHYQQYASGSPYNQENQTSEIPQMRF